MKHTVKKIIALTLILCSLAGMVVPAAPAASAAEYQFPDAGKTVDLGIILKGNANFSTSLLEIVEYNGRQYLGVPVKGSKFFVLALTDYIEGKPNANGNYIYAQADSGTGIPNGIAVDSKGVFYVTGDSRNIFWYDLKNKKSGSIAVGASALTAVTVDENDNIYAVDGGGKVYRIDGNTKTAKTIYTATEVTTLSGVVWGGGKVFVQGPKKDSEGGGSALWMLDGNGKLLATYALPETGGTKFLSYLDGVLFVGIANTSTTGDGFIALDTAGNKLTRLDMGKNTAILGMVTNPHNGKAYMCVESDGTYEYDVATRKLSRKVSNVCNRSLKTKNYVRNGSDLLLLSPGPTNMTTIHGPSKNTVSLSNIMTGTESIYSARSMVTGVAGTGVAVYVGAYLSPTVASYSPNAGTPVNSSVFSNGHAQTDNMIQYKGKIYAGVYSGGYLVEYDPKTGEVRELIHGLTDYDQLRIHGLAAGDDKIFFSTIPGDQKLGGCIGWYDLKTDTYYCERNVIKDQAAITLAYDEDKDILYGGTTIRGGTNADKLITAEQAVLFAYNVKTKKLLDSVTVGDLTGDKPKNISGIAQDPDTGKFWGMVSHTLFSFAYEGGKLKVTKEWAAATTPSDPYPNSASKSWFGRPILFDGVGGMYIGLNQTKYGIMKFTIGDDGKVKDATSISSNTTRIYAMGADGNLYYYDDQLHMITLPNRVNIVKGLIDAAKKTDIQSVTTAFSAYDALTQKEKDRLGSDYYNKLMALEDDDWYTEPTVTEPPTTTPPTTTPPATTPPETEPSAVDETMAAINAIGKVSASSGPIIQNARASYDGLTAAQKKQVTNYQTLVDAEKAYAAILSQQTPTTPPETKPTVPEETEPEVDNDVIFVKAYIDAIGEVAPSSGPVIQAARQYYNELTSAQKKQVTNYQVLLDAEKAFAKLESQTPPPATDPEEDVDEAVQDVIGAINAIGKVTAASGSVIQNARVSYDSLTKAQKSKITNYQTLVAAEKAYAEIVSQQTPTTPPETTPTQPTTPPETTPTQPTEPEVDNDVIFVKAYIDAIGEVTPSSGPVIQAARQYYDELTAAQKKQVTNYQTLVAAEKAFAKLESQTPPPATDPEEDVDEGVQDVIGAINAIGKVSASSGPVIQNARSSYDSLTATQKKQITNYQVLVAAEKAYAAILSQQTPTTPPETTPTDPDEPVNPTVPEETYPDEDTVPDTQPGGEVDDQLLAQEVISAINAIGEVTDASGQLIADARYLYNALTETEKAKVTNLQVLLDAEKAYEALTAPTTPSVPEATEPSVPDETDPTVDTTVPDETLPTVPTEPEEELDTAVIVAQVQINAIGQVTLGSGPVIQAARETYDALTPAQQKKVNNLQALLDAEAAFAQLSADDGNVDPQPAEDDNDMLIYILVGAGVFVAVLAAVLIIARVAKKKAPVGEVANDGPQTQETPVEE